MHQLANNISSAIRVGLEVFSTPEAPSPVPNTFQSGAFPTKLRYLYLRSSKNQNQVTTIGYRYVTSSKIEYHVAKCRQDKATGFMLQMNLPPVKDIFSRKIGRAIVSGRFDKYQPKEMTAETKDEMYNKFIYLYHPDRSSRRHAKHALMIEVLNAEKINSI